MRTALRMLVVVVAGALLCGVGACASTGAGGGDRPDAERGEAADPNEENLRQVLRQRPR